MKRYYLSKIFLDTTDPTFPQWRHKVQTYPNVLYQGGEIKTGVDGKPTEKALLVIIASIDQTKFVADPDLVVMPDLALDAKLSTMATLTKTDTATAVQSLGYTPQDVNAVWGNTASMRDVLNHYGQLNNTKFDVNNFDLTEF